jgi:hypothetical protein
MSSNSISVSSPTKSLSAEGSLVVHCLIIAAVIAAGAVPVEVQTLDGQKQSGELTALGPQQLVVQTADGPASFEPAKLMAVTFSRARQADAVKPIAVVELIDETRLRLKSFSTVKGDGKIELAGGGSLTVPTKLIRYVRFLEGSPNQSQIARQWDEILALKPGADLLVTRNKGALDYTEGLVRDVGGDTIDFGLDGDKLLIKRPRVEAIFYFRAAEPALRESKCALHLGDDSEIIALDAELNDNRVTVSTVAGAKLDLPLQALRRIDYSLGKVQYLSDLEAELTEVTPYFGAPKGIAGYTAALEPRKDQSLDGEPLKLVETTYTKGLALHSQTRLAYRLAGKFRQFSAIAGIDDAVTTGGNVRLQISGDGKPLWEGTIERGDDPQPLELDVTGVKRLELVVGFGEDLDIGDHLDLCEAKVTK